MKAAALYFRPRLLDDVEQIQQDDDGDRNSDGPKQNTAHGFSPFWMIKSDRPVPGIRRGKAPVDFG
jgi:hypothetical protein